MSTKKIFESFVNKKIDTIVYTGALNANFIKDLSKTAKNVYFFSKLKLDPFKDIKNITTFEIGSTVEEINNWPKSRGMADAIIFGFSESFMDAKIHLSFWMPILRKGGLFFILNADESMEKAMIAYAESIDPDFYDIHFDKENKLLTLEHK